MQRHATCERQDYGRHRRKARDATVQEVLINEEADVGQDEMVGEVSIKRGIALFVSEAVVSRVRAPTTAECVTWNKKGASKRTLRCMGRRWEKSDSRSREAGA